MHTVVSIISQHGCYIACALRPVNFRAGLKQLRLSRSNLCGTPLSIRKVSKILTSSRQTRLCRSELLQDAPFIAAIGACIVSSLVLQRKVEDNASLGEDDVRNGAITIISFIPLFNWLGWIFAWLDTNDQRYLFYACAYLAPYVRTGFSFPTDETWLLLLGYFACLGHIQLEINSSSAGVKSGSTFFQDGLDNLQQLGKSKLSKPQSRKFDDSISPGDEDTSRPAEVDLSQIELSEFDKKLLATQKKEVPASSENPEKDSGTEANSDK